MDQLNEGLLRLILLAIVIVSVQSCNDCHKVECPGFGESIELVFLKDGNNVFFESDPIVPIDDLKIISESRGELTNYAYMDRIQIWMMSGDEYQFIIGTLDTVILKARVEVYERGECCDQYRVDHVQLDGNVICQENCEIIEINL